MVVQSALMCMVLLFFVITTVLLILDWRGREEVLTTLSGIRGEIAAMRTELATVTAQATAAAAGVAQHRESLTQLSTLARSVAALIPTVTAQPETPVDATGDRPAQLPRIDVETEDDRETPPDTPRAAAPQDGEGGEIAFLPLGEDTLAGIDVLAAHWRVTREEAIGWCLRTGAEHVEQHGPGSGEHYESREELAARLVEVGLHQHLAALPALAAQHAATATAKDRDHGEEVTRSSHREPRPRRRALVGIARARLTRIAWARTATQTKLSAGALAPLPRVGDVVSLRAVVLGVEPDGVILEVPDVIEPRRVLVPPALIAGPWVPRG
jgi:hypothetical protein